MRDPQLCVAVHAVEHGLESLRDAKSGAFIKKRIERKCLAEREAVHGDPQWHIVVLGYVVFEIILVQHWSFLRISSKRCVHVVNEINNHAPKLLFVPIVDGIEICFVIIGVSRAELIAAD